jgi:glucosamine--fructose-6-phosphate aminotransferase (isomerizing)
MGTKRTIVSTGHVHIGKGKSDGASILVIPLLGANNTITHLLLLHISYNEELPLEAKIDVLGYRYADIRNLVNEYNLPWQDDHLKSLTLESLFCESIEAIAGQIRARMIQSEPPK